MDVLQLQQEIIKLLQKGAMTAGDIRNALNRAGSDVSQDEVLDALLWLEGQFVVARDLGRNSAVKNGTVV